MTHRVFQLGAMASLVLLLATAALWAWSYPNWAVFAHRGHLVLVVLEPRAGSIYPRFAQKVEESSQVRADRFWRIADQANKWRGTMGFRVGEGYIFYKYGAVQEDLLSGSFTILTVPFWFIVTLLAMPLAACALRWRQRRRRATRGLCASCGYDVRATPERCPECGAVPEPRWRTAA